MHYSLTTRGIPLRWSTEAASLFIHQIKIEDEPIVLDFIDSLEKSDVLFDVGACGGRFALYSAAKGILTHAFEPDTPNYQLLLANKNLNQIDNLVVHKMALSNTTGKDFLELDNREPGSPGKVLKGIRGYATCEEIDTITADDFCKSYAIQPTALKIDVDGAEYRVLQGAVRTLATVHSIMIELRSQGPIQACTNVMQQHGFKYRDREKIAPGLYNYWYVR